MLLWLDLETTGLDPREDFIMEVAWTFTNDDLGPVLDGGAEFAIRSYPIELSDSGRRKYREAVPFVFDMHADSGLAEECIDFGTDLEFVENELIDDIRILLPKNEALYLAGASVHFDKGFLKEWMRSLHPRLSHRVYDTSTLKAFFEPLGLHHGVENKGQHRAANDVEEVLTVARKYRQTVQMLDDTFLGANTNG